MQSEILTFEQYNAKSLVVRGDRDKFSSHMKLLGGRWNSKLKGGPGWLVPLSKKEELESLKNKDQRQDMVCEGGVCYLREDNKISNLKDKAKARDEQNKYRRAVSRDKVPRKSPEVSSSSSSSPSTVSEEEKEEEKEEEIEIEREEPKPVRKVNSTKEDNKILNYYRSFSVTKSPKEKDYHDITSSITKLQRKLAKRDI